MKLFVYILCQCLWGMPQTLLGAVLFMLTLKDKKSSYKGDVIIYWKSGYSASLGIFVFIARDLPHEEQKRLFVHEFGHSIQSLIFGPLYLPLMALPSMIWCMLPPFKRYRIRKGISYYDFFTERLADRLGESFLKRK